MRNPVLYFFAIEKQFIAVALDRKAPSARKSKRPTNPLLTRIAFRSDAACLLR